jgi:hypothetical protein
VQQTGSPSDDPALWLLATEAGEPVGALTANISGDRGWVDELGVLAPSEGEESRGLSSFAPSRRSRVAGAGRCC